MMCNLNSCLSTNLLLHPEGVLFRRPGLYPKAQGRVDGAYVLNIHTGSVAVRCFIHVVCVV